jgi:hypothetical protein
MSNDAEEVKKLVEKINEQQKAAGRDTTITEPKDD